MTIRRRLLNPNVSIDVLTKTLLTVFVVLVCGVAQAHVALDSPNGGEVLEVGSITSIAWHEIVAHDLLNFDLWYSTSGPDGPWTEIASNLVPQQIAGAYSYQWTVADMPSNAVRVRVRQDNEEYADFDDISDDDLTIHKAMEISTVELEPSRDATLYEESGAKANGSGSFFFTGRTEAGSGESERRALIAFDISGSVPLGSTITSVDLGVNLNKTISGSQVVELRRVLESWLEGPADPAGQEGGGAPASNGDVTWDHRAYPNTLWSTPGGTLAASRSAAQPMAGVGPYVFQSTQEMVADVQGWLDDPSSNHGWALVVPSAGGGSAKRFGSREGSASSRPILAITYEEPVPAPPTAAFDFSPANPFIGETVRFNDLSTGVPTSWSWDFGDGAGATDQNPTHIYPTEGTYTVSLSASNADGSDSNSMDITVRPDGVPALTELVIVPAAANATGAGNSVWVTTLDVNNSGSTTASYRLLWLPRDTDNSSPTESELFTIEPGASRRFQNLLDDVFGLSNAAGAVTIASDSEDIEAMSRTFNQSDNGTFGQSLPGVPTAELIPAGDRARVLFLTENNDFRSNLGLVNGSGDPITVEWEFFAADGSSLGTGAAELPPWGNKQLNRVLGNFAPIEAAYADVWTSTSGGAFTCYGSVLDEATSDPTTVLPR